MVNKIKSKKMLFQIFLAAVVLVSGLAIGSGGVILLEKNDIIRIRHHHKHEPSEIAKYLSEKYQLSKEQTAKVQKVITESLAKKQAARKEMLNKLEIQREQLVLQMQDILTAEQFEKWHKDFLEWIQRTKDRRRRY